MKLNEWNGKRFSDWCSSDPDDERTIHYVLYMKSGEKKRFSSKSSIPMSFYPIIKNSIIRNLSLAFNRWFVTIVEM